MNGDHFLIQNAISQLFYSENYLKGMIIGKLQRSVVSTLDGTKKVQLAAKKSFLEFRGFRTFFAVGHPLCDVVLFLVDLFLPSDVQQKRCCCCALTSS